MLRIEITAISYWCVHADRCRKQNRAVVAHWYAVEQRPGHASILSSRTTLDQDTGIIGVVQDNLPRPVSDIRQTVVYELEYVRVTAVSSPNLHALCNLTDTLLEANGTPSMYPEYPCLRV